MFFEDARSDDQVGDLTLFAHFPVHEIFDVGMIGVEHDHLGRATRRAADLIAPAARSKTLETTSDRRRAAAGKLLAGAANLREVRAAAGAALKNTCFAEDAVEKAAFVDEIVFDRRMKHAETCGC